MYPGSCLMGDKIFFVGGQRKAHRGKLKSSKYIYSLDLSNESFGLKMENAKTPFKVIYPRIAAGTRHAILAGGKHPKTGQLSKHIFRRTLSSNCYKRMRDFHFFSKCCS